MGGTIGVYPRPAPTFWFGPHPVIAPPSQAWQSRSQSRAIRTAHHGMVGSPSRSVKLITLQLVKTMVAFLVAPPAPGKARNHKSLARNHRILARNHRTFCWCLLKMPCFFGQSIGRVALVASILSVNQTRVDNYAATT